MSEEAKCRASNDCKFTYTNKIPAVKDISLHWSRDQYWMVVVIGYGFTGNEKTTELFIGGRKQQTVSVEKESAKFRITDIMGVTIKDMELYFDVGLPEGFDTVIRDAEFTLEPRITAVSPNSGSIGGSLIVANVEGVGPFEKDEFADYKR